MDITYKNIINVDETLVELVRKWRNSKPINQYMITNHHISKEEHHRWFTNLKTKKNAKVWIIRYCANPIGLVYLTNIDYKNKSTEWGFYIADKSVRGKGIGSATLYTLMEYVFDTLRFQKMNTKVLENNAVAIQMYEKFGFAKDDTKKKFLDRDEARLGIFNMTISCETWKSIRKTLKCNNVESLI